MSKLPRFSNCLPVGNVLCRPALFCDDGVIFQPVDSRWPPLPAGDVPTALFRPCEEFLVFIVQESARKCASDGQPASVLTSGRVFCAWHSNSCKVYPFCILLNSEVAPCALHAFIALFRCITSRCHAPYSCIVMHILHAL